MSTPMQALMRRYSDEGDVRALVQLAPQLKQPQDRLLFAHLKMAFDLRDARKTRAKTVQLVAENCSCQQCSPKHLSLVPIDVVPEEIVPAACDCMANGLCSLVVSAWIKLPGKKPFIDR